MLNTIPPLVCELESVYLCALSCPRYIFRSKIKHGHSAEALQPKQALHKVSVKASHAHVWHLFFFFFFKYQQNHTQCLVASVQLCQFTLVIRVSYNKITFIWLTGIADADISNIHFCLNTSRITFDHFCLHLGTHKKWTWLPALKRGNYLMTSRGMTLFLEKKTLLVIQVCRGLLRNVMCTFLKSCPS